MLERLVHRQISDYLERNNLLSYSQFGFRGERSTQHAVTLFTEHIRNNMEQSRCTGALFTDLRKAFDTVHHGTLLDKLRCYGIQIQNLPGLKIIYSTESSSFPTINKHHKLSKANDLWSTSRINPGATPLHHFNQ